MNLLRAETKAKYLVKELEPFCEKIEMVGNIRRRKQDIDNIDILLAPKSALLFGLMAKLVVLGCENGMKVSDKKTLILKDDLGEIRANFLFTSLVSWPVMLFVKTGGSKSIKRVEKLCENKKWALSVGSGSIYDENGKKLPIKEEKDIFTLLEIPFITPDWRE